jgi:putative membrane-bound dehydrogenase-like protein
MTMRAMIGLAILVLSCAEPGLAQDAKPLRVFIRAGKKTHGPGEHDHPRFLQEWVPLLKARGAQADGAMEFPTAEQLEKTDVLVFFCAEGGTILPDERARLDAFLKRGGGLTVIHDAVCGNDPQWFKTVVGGAWEHGKSKYLHGHVGIYLQDYEHPITKGMSNFFVDDEIYWDLHLMPEAKVVGTAFRTAHEITPQIWTYEKDAYRAYVNILGHKHATFSLPHVRALLLRGIAWTARRDVDALVSPEELAALRYPPGGPTVPGAAHEKLTVPADFDLKLVAAEPDIVKPIHVGWDPKGRLWVLQTPQYPAKAETWKRRPSDSLVYFDGGKRRVFYDQLDLPTAFAFHKDGVIVMAAPEILFLRDTDGDGAADKREVLFSGFGFGDTHATASNLRAGLDGWIYATQGYSGGGSRNVTNAAGQAFGHIPNGLFRFRPDGSAIETVAAYGGNTWGLDLSWDQEIFFSMANGSHLRHVVMPETALSRGRSGKIESYRDITDHRDAHPPIKHAVHPYLQIDNVGGFTAAAGGTLYDGGAWPDAWRKMHLVTECTINLVHRDRIEASGVSYQAFQVDKEGEFVGSSDLWFRPIDTQIGPDGAVYIVDFYNQAVVHNDTRGPKHGPFNAAVRPDRDHLHGRLWRLQHKQARALPATEFASTAGLVKALEHPNRWARQTAQRLLVERGEGAAELAALLKATAMPEAKVAALWALQRLGALSDAQVAAGLQDADPGVRKNAARAGGALGKGDAVRKALLAAAQDADPRVRLEALVALAQVPGDGAEELLAVGPKLNDPWSRAALVGALASAPVEAIGAAAKAKDKATLEALTLAVGARQDAALAAKVVLSILDFAPEQQALVLAALAKTLKPDVAPAAGPDLLGVLEALLKSPDSAVVSGALTLAGRWVKDDALAKALEPTTKSLFAVLESAVAPDEARLQAFTGLLSLASARARAVAAAGLLLAPTASIDLQKGAIEAMGATADAAVPAAFLGAWPKLAAGSREAVLGQLLKRPEWTSFLIAELEAKRLRPNDLGPSALFRLRTHPDKATAKKAVEVLDAVMGAQNKAKDQIIAQLAPAVDKPGDAAKGKALFTENCLKCHQYRGEGRSIAPDLTGMGVHGKAGLLVQIIDPNRTVEANYVSFNVRTKGGDIFNGIVARETKDHVVLKNNEGDKEIRRADIEAMQSTGLSLMPEGLEALGADALRDILHFLTTDAGGFRFIDLQSAFTMSNVKGLFDTKAEPHNMRFARYGVVVADGIPFNLVDPGKSVNGNNAVVLKGGLQPNWQSKTSLPQRVEVPMGFGASRIHVLGGVAAWGARAPRPNGPVCAKVIVHYADGKTQEIPLRDGVEFADYNAILEVPGSKLVPNLVTNGQVRWFSLTPSRKDPIHHLTLESPDREQAPVFFALTAEVGEPRKESGHAAPVPAFTKPVLVVGGGSSHDFDKWWKGADAALLDADYTADTGAIAGASVKLLYLANNQPIADPAARKAVFAHVDAGKGLLVGHAAAWYNWKDWPEYNRELVAGGSRGHEKFQDFEVKVVDAAHPVMAGVPAGFTIKDELYRFEKDAAGPEIQVLAKGVSIETGKEWPVVWVVKHPARRIVVNTLGHAGEAHGHAAYQAILKNTAGWLAK